MNRYSKCQKAKYILSKGLLIKISKRAGNEEKCGDRALIYVTQSLCASPVIFKGREGNCLKQSTKTTFKLFDMIQTYRIQHICNL